MKKKGKRKSAVRKRKSSSAPKGAQGVEKALINNLVALQKVNTDLAEKFDHLSKNISSLLNLFEAAAKSFGENPVVQASEKDREFLEKIDKLLEQNKTIAKGLTLMEEKVRERIERPAMPPQREFRPAPGGRLVPRF